MTMRVNNKCKWGVVDKNNTLQSVLRTRKMARYFKSDSDKLVKLPDVIAVTPKR